MKGKKMIVTGLAMMTAFAVCSSTGMAEEKVKLDFWDMTWGGTDYISTAEGLVQQFNESQDEIEVVYQSIPWDNFYQTFTTAIASETAPDISTGSGYQQHQFAVMDEILSLDSIIDEWEAEGKSDDFIDGAVEQFQWEGEQIAIPFNADPRAIYYRKDIFEENGMEVPGTWEELVETAKKLTTDDRYGFTCAGSDAGGYWSMLFFIFGEGGSIFNENGEPDFASEANLQALKHVQEMAEAGVFPAGNASYTSEDAQKLFLQGKAAMIFTAADFAPAVQAQGEEFAEKVEIMPLIPAADGELKSPGGMNGIMAYKQTEYPEECKTFIKWWSENSECLWSEGHMGAFSVRSSILASDYFKTDKYKSSLAEKVMPYFVTTNQPVSHAFPAMAGLEGELIFADAFQMALSLDYTPEEIAEEMNEKIAEILEDY